MTAQRKRWYILKLSLVDVLSATSLQLKTHPSEKIVTKEICLSCMMLSFCVPGLAFYLFSWFDAVDSFALCCKAPSLLTNCVFRKQIFVLLLPLSYAEFLADMGNSSLSPQALGATHSLQKSTDATERHSSNCTHTET